MLPIDVQARRRPAAAAGRGRPAARAAPPARRRGGRRGRRRARRRAERPLIWPAAAPCWPARASRSRRSVSDRRAAGDRRGRQRAVRRPPLRARDLRRLRLAAAAAPAAEAPTSCSPSARRSTSGRRATGDARRRRRGSSRSTSTPDAIGAHRRWTLGVIGDAGATARELDAELAARAPGGVRTPELARQIARRRWRDEPFEDGGDDGTVDPRTLTHRARRLLPARAHGGGRLGRTPGLAGDVPARPRRRGSCSPGVPGRRARPRQRDRRRGRAARTA